MNEKKYRLVTRSDMDGLVCGTLLKYLNIIDEIAFVHPKDMQDGKIQITKEKIASIGKKSPLKKIWNASLAN